MGITNVSTATLSDVHLYAAAAGFLNGFCSGTDYIDHHVRVGEHDDRAAGDLRRFGAPVRLALRVGGL